MLLPVLQDYLIRAKEKESVVISGDNLLGEIKERKDLKVYNLL